ncbi:MAG: hypothetical protein ACREUC_10870 [Steroidobacteraceae bacterium]
MKQLLVRLAAIGLLALGADATSAAEPRSLVEIYRIAPGQHAAFVRFIALCDEANREAGLPPRQLYVHQDGGGWDFIVIQPASVTDEQGRALDAAFKKLGIPQGGKFFVKIREFITEHSDTFATGPTTAADWLQKLE